LRKRGSQALGFYHAAVRGEIALQDREARLRHRSVFSTVLMTSSLYTSASAIFSPSVLPVTVHRIEMQMIPDPAHQAGQSAGIVEIFHQIFVAARPHIGDHRHLAAWRSRNRRDRYPGRARRRLPRSGEMMALVEQPIAIATVIAFSNALRD